MSIAKEQYVITDRKLSKRSSLSVSPASPVIREQPMAFPVYGSSSDKRYSVSSTLSFDSIVEEPSQIQFVHSRPAGYAPNVNRSSSRASLPTSPTSTPARPSLNPRNSLPPHLSTHHDGKEREKRETRRWRTAVELRDTERSFVNTLQVVDEHYYQPLLAQVDTPAAIVGKKDMNEVFPVFHDVVRIAKLVLETLEAVVPDLPSTPLPLIQSNVPSSTPSSSYEPSLSTSSDTLDSERPATPMSSRSRSRSKRRSESHAHPLRLGFALLPVLPFLKTYSFFIVNFSWALAKLGQLETSPAWTSFVDERRRLGIGEGISLGGMLLSVVQRVPRYKLLMQDLIRFTEYDHPDLPHLLEAFRLVDQVASHFEAHIAGHTSSLRMLEIQKALVDLLEPLIQPGRRLLREGTIREVDHRQTETKCHCFLLSDALIVATGDPTRELHLRTRMALDKLTVLAVDGGERPALEIRGPEKSFIARTTTTRERDAWVAAIQQATAELLGSASTSPRHEEQRTRRPRRISLPSGLSSFPFAGLLETSPPLSIAHPPSFLGAGPTSIPGSPVIEKDKPELFVSSPTDMIATATATDSGTGIPTIDDYSAPVWVPDAQAVRCRLCRGAFNSLWRRKHHCRLCGAVVCWECSQKTFAIGAAGDGDEERLARTCDACFEACFCGDQSTAGQVAVGLEDETTGASTKTPNESASSVMDRLTRLLSKEN